MFFGRIKDFPCFFEGIIAKICCKVLECFLVEFVFNVSVKGLFEGVFLGERKQRERFGAPYPSGFWCARNIWLRLQIQLLFMGLPGEAMDRSTTESGSVPPILHTCNLLNVNNCRCGNSSCAGMVLVNHPNLKHGHMLSSQTTCHLTIRTRQWTCVHFPDHRLSPFQTL